MRSMPCRHILLALLLAGFALGCEDDADPVDAEDTLSGDTTSTGQDTVETLPDTAGNTDAGADGTNDTTDDTTGADSASVDSISADTMTDADDIDADMTSEPQDHWLLIGTGAWGGGVDGTVRVHALDGASGELSDAPAVELTVGHLATFMAFDDARSVLHVADEIDAVVRSYNLDTATGALTFLAEQSTSGSGSPVYVTLDPAGTHLLVASYGGGRAEVLGVDPINGAVASSLQVVDSGRKSHAVLVAPGAEAVVVPALEEDHVAQYRYDEASGALTPADPPALELPAGTGPRHLVFSADGAHAWLIGELDNTLSTLSFDATSATLTLVDTVDALPTDFQGSATGADILVSPDGATVYASLRPSGDEGLVVVARVSPVDATLEVIGHVGTGGETPRNLALSPDGRWLVAGNQSSDSVRLFTIDPATGMPSAVQTLDVGGAPFFVMLVPRP